MNRKIVLTGFTLTLAAVALVACGKKDDVSGAITDTGPAKELGTAEVVLTDIADIKPGYNIGISYDKEVGQFAPLAKQVQAFVEQQTETFKSAAGDASVAVKNTALKPTLSLYLTSVANTPRFAAVAASGSSYLGKDNATPLLQRWVYLPQSKQAVGIPQMFPGNKLASLLDHPGAPLGMEPIADDSGHISAIRFVYLIPAADNPDDAVTKVTLQAAELASVIDPKFKALLSPSASAP